ncbi:hypothetical protein FHT08_003460 [Xanthomonas campestris]|uniref:DUF6058 family natural product biosynthesis protein n=1 Tax=Xanthomonas sp. CFBP 8151 TaxID=3035310 RepID=UPI00141B0CDB|nr:DUF6058 family natural product biosynthesis protein [Xanthomonas sp. CFBP 8151]NIJ78326.1 hypothetical protein [Xanthomonas sp. CFBP 8151]
MQQSLTLANYLQTHFVDKPTFASLAGITVDRLDALLEADAIPKPTYTCDGHSIRSAAFGVTYIDERLVGDYFRPECRKWVDIADRAAKGGARDAVLAALGRELETGLRAHIEDTDAIEKKIQGFIPYFLDGTFGLCVADPSLGMEIARKEMLQERLTSLTEAGSNPAPEEIGRDALLQLIDAYADSAMPFSPVEYARSSRKRLVDDLRPLVAMRKA